MARKKTKAAKRKKRLTTQMIIRLKPAEKARYQEAADLADEDLSVWVRSACKAALRKPENEK